MSQSNIRLLCVFAISAALGTFWGCGRQAVDTPDPRLPVFVGIPPLAYLVEQIGGEHVRVDALMAANQDPHTFEPAPRQLQALGNARLFFEVGMPFERLLVDKIRETCPRLVVVDASTGIRKRPMDAACEHVETHDTHDGHEEHGLEHQHAGDLDPHVWLSLPLVKQMSQNIAAALVEVDPVHAESYQKNLATLQKRVDALQDKVSRQLKPYHGAAFYVFHPAFGYFADAYGLKQVAVEAGGRSPTPKQLQALIAQARNDRVKVIFVQPQSPPQASQTLADAVGAKVVEVDGLSKDILQDVDDIAAKIAAAMKGR